MSTGRLRSTEHRNGRRQRREIEYEEGHEDEDEAMTLEGEDKPKDVVGLKGDRRSIALLMFLYVLQGIPLGVAASVPFLLQTRKISYKDQAMFSFVHWPFSLKLFWAPIVDSVYVSWFGRRKSWLVPTQYLIGLFMLLLSTSIDSMMGEGESRGGGQSVSVFTLTAVFFMLNFLAATQDIAVDGWALTMLSKYALSPSALKFCDVDFECNFQLIDRSCSEYLYSVNCYWAFGILCYSLAFCLDLLLHFVVMNIGLVLIHLKICFVLKA